MFKHEFAIITATLLALSACSTEDDIDSEDRALLESELLENGSLEQALGLFPQTLDGDALTDASYSLDGSTPRYVVLGADEGPIDLESLEITDGRESRGLTELFAAAPPAQTGLLHQDALLLVAVPEAHVAELCERFQFAIDGDLVTVAGESLLFRAPAGDGLEHALCLRPLASGAAAAGHPGATDLVADDDPQAYGSGSYTVWVKSLVCNDPRDWENWPFNGDEARMRGWRDGLGGDQIWSQNDVESGDSFSPGRYIHFNANAKLELYDYDSEPWNANDKLGQEWIYSAEACGGDHYGDFDGSGSGHDWNYDLTYRVYGPTCTCQAARPAIYTYSDVETCSVTSQTITNYTYYCSGGTQKKQAWGNVTRHCQTNHKKYNDSCELHTYVSQQLQSECDKYQYGVAIGAPVSIGTCGPGGGCYPEDPLPQHSTSFEDQLVSGEVPGVLPVIEPICPL